jgi:hypothetical protein
MSNLPIKSEIFSALGRAWFDPQDYRLEHGLLNCALQWENNRWVR